MALFDVGTGLFMGGVVDQSNRNRQLSVQESLAELEKTKLGISIKNTQQEQATEFINELVGIATEIKKNFPGTSGSFAESDAAKSVEALIEQAEELAQQTGLPTVDYRTKISSIPTAIDAAQLEAKQSIEEAESKIGAAGEDPQKRKALGVEGPAPKIMNFLFPGEKKPRQVNVSDPEQLAALPPGAAVVTGFGVEAADISALTGFTEKDVRNLRGNIEGLQTNIENLEKTRQAFEETPEAGGIVGSIIETGTGILEQIPLIGDEAAGLISDPEQRAKVKEARTRARLAVANMLETVTGEESGRFTDTERKIAKEILGALDKTASAEQIQTALKTVIGIMKDAQNRELNKLLTASGADLTEATGRQEFYDILLKNGFSEDQALDVLAEMTAQRGIKF